MVTKSCKGSTCTDPWSVIHPKGDVKTLKDALNKRFDAFYLSEVAKKVSFEKCELGYILESEGPQDAIVFDASDTYSDVSWVEEL
jgi:N-acetylglucosamine-6-sulfatase